MNIPVLIACFGCCTLLNFGIRAQQSLKQIIRTEAAPAPIGPYSQAVRANGFLFVAGQIGINPQTKQLVKDSFEAETSQVMENIGAILRQAGLDFSHVVKTTIYLTDLSQFPKANELYGKYFKEAYPARETVGVAALPGGAAIEISVTAVFPGP